MASSYYASSVMWGGAIRRRFLGLVAVGLLAAAAGLAAHATGLLAGSSGTQVNVRFSLRGRQPPPASVVVVGIDNDSLGQLPRYPFSRRAGARPGEAARGRGAAGRVRRVVRSTDAAAADEALFEAARASSSGRVRHVVDLSLGGDGGAGGDANLASVGDQAAAADLLPDSDGVLRHTLAEVNGLPPVAAVVARRLNARHLATSLQGGWIDFPGPPGTVHSLSFAQVLDGLIQRVCAGRWWWSGRRRRCCRTCTERPPGARCRDRKFRPTRSRRRCRLSAPSPSGVVTVLLILMLAFLVPFSGVRLERWGA